MNARWKIFLAGLICFSTAHTVLAADDEIIAVLSSESAHYKEALDGFQNALGHAVSVVNLEKNTPRIGGGTKLIVVFGGKAALYPYRDAVPVITCMAPGIDTTQNRRDGDAYISMAPPADLFFQKIKEIQPTLKRLAFFWSAESMRDYVKEMQDKASANGIELVVFRLDGPASLPNRLREIQGRVNAVMLPPDPSLVNNQNFTTIKDFSWANHLPFYVPTEGLVEKGGTASISSSFNDIGGAAAKAARDILNGNHVKGIVYSEKVGIAVNVSVAKSNNLILSPAFLQKIDKSYP